MNTSSKDVREVLIAAVDFMRCYSYFHNPDLVVACEVLTRLSQPPTHNMIITDNHVGDPA